MLYAFHEIISQLLILQYVSRSPNLILLSKDAVADYANTPYSSVIPENYYQDTR